MIIIIMVIMTTLATMIMRIECTLHQEQVKLKLEYTLSLNGENPSNVSSLIFIIVVITFVAYRVS